MNKSQNQNVFSNFFTTEGEVNFGQAVIDLYSAQASFAWPSVDLARPLRRSLYYQLFRERLSEKVHATIPKGIVGGFEYFLFFKEI